MLLFFLFFFNRGGSFSQELSVDRHPCTSNVSCRSRPGPKAEISGVVRQRRRGWGWGLGGGGGGGGGGNIKTK